MAGIGKALGQCWRRRLFLICPSWMSELWPLTGKLCFLLEPRGELTCLFHEPGLEFSQMRKPGSANSRTGNFSLKKQLLGLCSGQGSVQTVTEMCRLHEILSWLNPSA